MSPLIVSWMVIGLVMLMGLGLHAWQAGRPLTQEPLNTPARRVHLEAPAAPSVLTPAPPSLADLPLGASGVVCGLADSLQGLTRRRLLDLGLTPGASVTAELRSLLGDPRAYRVRGALIALRREQAVWVRLEPLPAASADEVFDVSL